MNDVVAAARELQECCESHGWNFCFIGGVALLRWGEPRQTIDADLTLLAGFGEEERFIAPLLEQFESRVPDGLRFAIENRVLLLRSSRGVGLDVALGALPFEEEAVRRASSYLFPPDISLRTCSAEDLIVMKAFAGRGQDWVDVEGIIARQAGGLDWGHIRSRLATLMELKGSMQALDRLESLRDESDARDR